MSSFGVEGITEDSFLDDMKLPMGMTLGTHPTGTRSASSTQSVRIGLESQMPTILSG